MPASESPVSGNNIVKEIPRRELAHNIVGQKLSHPQLQTPNSLAPIEGETDESATQRSKKHLQSLGEEALIDKVEQYSPPSFCSIKDSDCDNSDNGNKHVSYPSLSLSLSLSCLLYTSPSPRDS